MQESYIPEGKLCCWYCERDKNAELTILEFKCPEHLKVPFYANKVVLCKCEFEELERSKLHLMSCHNCGLISCVKECKFEKSMHAHLCRYCIEGRILTDDDDSDTTLECKDGYGACSKCRLIKSRDNMSVHDGALICNDCSTGKYTKCFHCNNVYPSDCMEIDPCGEPTCRPCRRCYGAIPDQGQYDCASCGSTHDHTDMRTNARGRPLCLECMRGNHKTCMRCWCSENVCQCCGVCVSCGANEVQTTRILDHGSLLAAVCERKFKMCKACRDSGYDCLCGHCKNLIRSRGMGCEYGPCYCAACASKNLE